MEKLKLLLPIFICALTSCTYSFIGSNSEIKYEDFKFMLMQLIEKDYKQLVCDGEYVDKLSIEAMRSSYGRKVKKDYTRHFLKKPKKRS